MRVRAGTPHWLVPAAIGAGCGATLALLLDRQVGRRRALMCDQVVHATHAAVDTLRGHAEDVRNRASGALHETAEGWPAAGSPDGVVVGPAGVRHAGIIPLQ